MTILSIQKNLLTAKKISNLYIPNRGGGRKPISIITDVSFPMPRANKMLPGLIKSLFFTCGFGCVTYAGMSIWHYESRKTQHLGTALTKWMQPQHKQFLWRQELNKWWNNLSEGQKVFWPICGLNLLVFGASKHAPLKAIIMRYFCSSPASKAVCLPLLLSTFCHFSLIHLSFNMFAFYTFSKTLGASLGKEQFLGLYLCSGVFSGLCSSAIKVARGVLLPSLGASGAILGMIGYFCCVHPDAELTLIFLPWYSFSADTALKAIMSLDCAGILFKWGIMDHASHLGGASLGIFYAFFGHYLWSNRHIIVKKWKTLTSE